MKNIDFTKLIDRDPVLKAQLNKMARIKGISVETLIRSFFSGKGRSTRVGANA